MMIMMSIDANYYSFIKYSINWTLYFDKLLELFWLDRVAIVTLVL